MLLGEVTVTVSFVGCIHHALMFRKLIGTVTQDVYLHLLIAMVTKLSFGSRACNVNDIFLSFLFFFFFFWHFLDLFSTYIKVLSGHLSVFSSESYSCPFHLVIVSRTF